jgi:hypothetical protein
MEAAVKRVRRALALPKMSVEIVLSVPSETPTSEVEGDAEDEPPSKLKVR